MSRKRDRGPGRSASLTLETARESSNGIPRTEVADAVDPLVAIAGLSRSGATGQSPVIPFPSLVELIPAMVYITPPDDLSELLYQSPQIAAMLGYTREEWQAHPEFWLRRVHPDDQHIVLASDELARATGKPFSIEYRFLNKDDQVVWVRDSAVLLRDRENRPLHWLGVTVDVTAEKEAEIALQRREQEFRTLAEHTPDMVARFDRGLRCVYVNQTSPSISERLPEGFKGNLIGEIGLPDDIASTWEQALKEVFDSGQPASFECAYPTASGERWFETRVVAEAGEGTEVEFVLSVSRDVTDQKRAERKLMRLNEKYQRILDDAYDMILTYDTQGNLTFANRRFFEISGYEQDELAGLSALDFFHPDDRAWMLEIIRKRFAGEPAEPRNQFRVVNRHGQVFWVESNVSPIYEGGKLVGFQTFVRDISDWRAAMDILAAQKRVLELLANDLPLSDVLHALCSLVEQQLDGSLAVLHVPDVGGRSFRAAGTRRIPPELRNLLEDREPRLLVGEPDSGDRERKAVDVVDLATDSGYRDAAGTFTRHGLRSLWMTPILSPSSGQSLGTLVVYSPEAAGPGERDLEFMIEAGNLAQLAIERSQAEAARREQEELLHLVLETLPVGVLFADAEGKITVSNPAGREIWSGARSADLESTPHYKGWWPDSGRAIQPEEWALTRAVQRGETSLNEEIEIEDLGGARKTILNSAVPLRREGEIAGAVIVNMDITERKQLEARLLHQALHDSLTGLPNRVLFRDRLVQALVRVERRQLQVAVLFLDLDNFKLINDSLGHQLGDELIVTIGRRLRRAVREQDTVARLGGDEFTVLLDEIHDIDEVIAVARRIEEQLRLPVPLARRNFHVSSSIGIAMTAGEIHDADDLVRAADTAMYRAKQLGRNQFVVFDPAMHDQTMERLDLENDLRRALEEDQFTVHYQPQYELLSGELVGFEALARWEHPERGLILPNDFIPVAEESGLIVPIGSKILRIAARQLREWLDRFPLDPAACVSVNLSARQFLHPNLAGEVTRILRETGIPPQRLLLEITESTIADDLESAVSILAQLCDLGIRLAIDDFGTGYSSLAHIKRFPLNYLKIDRSFTRGLGETIADTALASSIIRLAHGMHLRVVAEGVETEAHLMALRSLDCDIGQGYLFSPPLPDDQMTAHIARYFEDTTRPRPFAEPEPDEIARLSQVIEQERAQYERNLARLSELQGRMDGDRGPTASG